jgi:hypothetical protein
MGTVQTIELADGARVNVVPLGMVRLSDGYVVAGYRLRFFSPGGELLFDDSTLTLPFRDDERALRDGAGFLSAYGDEHSGAGTFLPELAPWADELALLSDDDAPAVDVEDGWSL